MSAEPNCRHPILPFLLRFHVERPFYYSRPLQTSYNKCVRLRSIYRHDLTTTNSEVVQWLCCCCHLLVWLGFEPNQRAVVPQDKISWPPIFYMFSCKQQMKRETRINFLNLIWKRSDKQYLSGTTIKAGNQNANRYCVQWYSVLFVLLSEISVKNSQFHLDVLSLKKRSTQQSRRRSSREGGKTRSLGFRFGATERSKGAKRT